MPAPESSIHSLLLDAFERVANGVTALVDGLSPAALNSRPFGTANSVSWLIWHLTRVQDDHMCEIAGRPQVWTTDGFFERFGLPHSVGDTGYGHDPAQVAATFVAHSDLLAEYQRSVFEATAAAIRELDIGRLDEIIDERFDPAVTVAVRIVSVIEDCLQHLGQANYVAGLVNPG